AELDDTRTRRYEALLEHRVFRTGVGGDPPRVEATRQVVDRVCGCLCAAEDGRIHRRHAPDEARRLDVADRRAAVAERVIRYQLEVRKQVRVGSTGPESVGAYV